jgi:hypothetical protein
MKPFQFYQPSILTLPPTLFRWCLVTLPLVCLHHLNRSRATHWHVTMLRPVATPSGRDIGQNPGATRGNLPSRNWFLCVSGTDHRWMWNDHWMRNRLVLDPLYDIGQECACEDWFIVSGSLSNSDFFCVCLNIIYITISISQPAIGTYREPMLSHWIWGYPSDGLTSWKQLQVAEVGTRCPNSKIYSTSPLPWKCGLPANFPWIQV